MNKPQLSKKQLKEISVELTTEARRLYELEAAMVYYNNIVDNKLAIGEKVTDEDLENLDNATEKYEKEINPWLSMEEIVKLQEFDRIIKQ